MARAIEWETETRDAREELLKRLEQAPAEHAEALLASYDLIQQMHDSGLISLLRGALASGDKILESAVRAGNTEEGIRGVRNAIILARMLGSIHPDLLQGFATAVSDTLGSRQPVEQPPGLFQLFAEFRQPELRRSMAVINKFLENLGTQLKVE